MRRTATMTLHWISFLSLSLTVAGGPSIVDWAFGVSGVTMCVIACAAGLLNSPGPKLDGTLRAAHPWLAWGMYMALGVVAGLTLWAQIGAPLDLADIHIYLLAAVCLHAIFHLWRHTALGDGALRRMTPETIHRML